MLIDEYNIDNLETDNLVIIYCDGSSNWRNKCGGYGVFLVYKNYSKEMYFSKNHTTIGRMELSGIIKALQSVKTNYKVVIYCDSEYVTNCINKGWLKMWSKFNFVGKKNEDLLKMYLEEYNRFKDISIRHIRGHIGVKGNERVDRLAKKGYKEALKRLKK